MSETKKEFFDAAEAWLCDGYALDLRYVGEVQAGGFKIWGAAVGLQPLEADRNLSFSIQTENLVAGQVQRYPVSKAEAIEVLHSAAEGTISLPNLQLVLPRLPTHAYYSEMHQRDRWFSELHLQVDGGRTPPPSAERLLRMDNDLRASQIPFDGLADLSAWFGLGNPAQSGAAPMVVLRVMPPVDLIIEQCGLRDDELKLVVHAHASFEVDRIGIAVRGVPGIDLHARRQAKNSIEWGETREGRREGIARISISPVDQVLTMLMIGTSTVRRHWFVDPSKARNNRLLALQHFDADLRMIRNAIIDSHDSKKFEQGVAALLYLHGFASVIPLETDAPDLVVSTPGGRMAVIECTTRITDVASKLGKLVDRRGALSKAIDASGRAAQILAVLICRLPRDQIAAHDDELRSHNVILFSRESLLHALNGVRNPEDPDKVFEDAQATLGAVGVVQQ
jgi:hypothetical protein